jgi:hypothetical protein
MRWRKPVGCPGGGVVVLNMTLCRDSETCHSNVVSVHSVGSETDWMNRKSVVDVITLRSHSHCLVHLAIRVDQRLVL